MAITPRITVVVSTPQITKTIVGSQGPVGPKGDTGAAPTNIPADNIADGSVNNAAFQFLNGVTSSIQTQLDGKSNTGHQHSGADITSGTVAAARLGSGSPSATNYLRGDGSWQNIAATELPSGIDVTKLADGTVDNTEFQALNGVTSSIQSQLDGKANTTHQHSGSDITSGTVSPARLGSGTPTNSTLLDGGGAWRLLTSADIPNLDASKITTGTINISQIPTGIDATYIGSGTVTNTEFSYLDGVTSSIQIQLDGKAASVHQHSGGDITSGTVAPARLGSGTPTSWKFLDGGGTWRSLLDADLPAGLSAGSGYGQSDPSAFAIGLYGYGTAGDNAKPGITCGGTVSAGSVIYNCPSAKTHNFLINGVLNMCIGSALGSTVDGNWVIGKYGNPSAIGSVTGVCGSGTSIYYNVPTGGGHSIRVNNTVVALVQSALISLSAPVTLGNSYTATAGSNQIVGTASGVQLNAPTGSAIVLSTNGTSRLNVSGTVATFTVPVVTPTATPASATATGTAGQWAWDANYIYICVATNTWRRVAHATW